MLGGLAIAACREAERQVPYSEFWERSSSRYTLLILDSAGDAGLSTALHRKIVRLLVAVALGWREQEAMAVVDHQRGQVLGEFDVNR